MKKLYLEKKYGKRPKKLIVCIIIMLLLQIIIPILQIESRAEITIIVSGQTTSNGEWEFLVRQDEEKKEVIYTKYKGNNTNVEIDNTYMYEEEELPVLINGSAFNNTNVENLILNKNTGVVNKDFNDSNLENIFVNSNNENYVSIDGVLYSKYGEDNPNFGKLFLICYPNKKKAEQFIVPENVIILGKGAFKNCINLKEIILPDELRTMGAEVFKNCVNLEKIILKNSDNLDGTFGFDVFYGCNENLVLYSTTNNINNYLGSNTQTVVVVIDNIVPTVIINKNTDEITSSNIILNINAEDTGIGLHNKPYSFDGGTTWQEDNIKTIETNQNVSIAVRDKLQNTYTKNINVTNIDKDNPVMKLNDIEVQNEGTYYYNDSVDIEITDNSELLNYKLYKDLKRDNLFTNYAVLSNGDKTLTATIENEGNYDLIVTDVAGNTAKTTFIIDKTIPELTIMTRDNTTGEAIEEPLKSENGIDYYKNAKFQIEFTEANPSKIYYTKDGGNAVYLDPNVKIVTINNETGIYIITLEDLAGNVVTKTIAIDNQKPTSPEIIINNTQNNFPINATIKLKTPTVISGISSIEYRVVTEENNEGQWAIAKIHNQNQISVTVQLPNGVSNISHQLKLEARVISGVGNTSDITSTEYINTSESIVSDGETSKIKVLRIEGDNLKDYAKEHQARIVVTDWSGLNDVKYIWSTSLESATGNEISINNATYSENTITIGNIATTPENVNGIYYLWVKATDRNNNSTSTLAVDETTSTTNGITTIVKTPIEFKLDNIAPTITLPEFIEEEDIYYGNISVIPDIKDANEPDVTVAGVTLEKYLEDWTQVNSYTKGTQIQKEGYYRIKATDSVGNESEWIYFVIDKTAPVIKINEDEKANGETYYYKDPISLDIIGEETYVITKNGVTVTNFNKEINLLGENGDGTYVITATDNVENTTSITVVVDSQAVEAPTISAKIDSTREQYEFNTWAKENISLTIEMENEPLSGLKVYEKYEINVNNSGEWAEVAVGQNISISNEGITTIKVRGISNAGTIGAESEVYTVKIDKQAPELTVTGDITTLTKENISLRITATDILSEIKNAKVNGTEITLSQQGINDYVISENGVYTIQVTDNAENITEKVVEIANIDKQAPKVEVLGNPTDWTNQDVTLAINAQDKPDQGASGIEKLTVIDTVQSTDKTIIENLVEEATTGESINGVALKTSIEEAGGTITGTGPWTITLKDNTFSVAVNGDVTVNNEITPTEITLVNGKAQYSINKNGKYKIVVTDNAGNTTEQIIEVTKIDKTAPTITGVTGNSTNWTNQDVTLTVEGAADIGGSTLDELTYSFDCGANWQNSNTKVYSQNTSGIIIKVRDAAGNIYTHPEININKIDKVVPTITISPLNKTTDNPTTVTVNVADEGGSGLKSSNVYQYYLSTSNSETINGVWKNFTSGTAFEIGTGLSATYYMHIKEISDNADNKVSAVSEAFIFDNLKEENPNPQLDLSITSNKYDINNTENLILRISPDTTVAQFKENIVSNASSVKVYNANNVQTGNSNLIGTGMKLKLVLESENKEFMLVVTGDSNGDGKADIVDLSKLKKHIIGAKLVEGIYLRALDTNFDNEVDIIDLSRVKKAIIKMITL